MLTTLLLLSATLTPASDARPTADVRDRPRIELWTNRGDLVYTRGQGARVYFRVDEDAYVTIMRVDTDGRVRVLFPRDPWEDNFARGGREYEVQHRSSRDAFFVDDDPGVGYVFAAAAADPFIYDPIVAGDHWDYRLIADGRVRGDPYVALTELVDRIVPPGYAAWDYDIVPYYVERHYDYPRFVCYDCHSYQTWAYWDPYAYSCVRFRLVIYDDPWYYPYRYYGTRVVVVRPSRPEPRFIFRGRRASSEPFVTRVRVRPVNDDTRRAAPTRDRGGFDDIPPPARRDRPDGRSDDRDRQDRPGDRPERPDRPDRPDRPERPDRPDNPNNPDRPERRERPDRPDRPARPERPDRPAGAVTSARPAPERRTVTHQEPRSAPRSEPRATPRTERGGRTEARPQRDEAKTKRPPRSEPELRRRKT